MRSGISLFFQASIVIIVLFFIFCRGVLVREATAIRALETQGFSEVQIEHKGWLLVGFRGGSKGDVAKFSARAKNPAGKTVDINVFVGWPFKGATVRTN